MACKGEGISTFTYQSCHLDLVCQENQSRTFAQSQLKSRPTQLAKQINVDEHERLQQYITQIHSDMGSWLEGHLKQEEFADLNLRKSLQFRPVGTRSVPLKQVQHFFHQPKGLPLLDCPSLSARERLGTNSLPSFTQQLPTIQNLHPLNKRDISHTPASDKTFGSPESYYEQFRKSGQFVLLSPSTKTSGEMITRVYPSDMQWGVASKSGTISSLPGRVGSFITCDRSRIHETSKVEEAKLTSANNTDSTLMRPAGVSLGKHHCYCHQPSGSCLSSTDDGDGRIEKEARLGSDMGDKEAEEEEENLGILSLKQCNNLKEKRRRKRIKDACDKMRLIVPGMSNKTDKATVFEYSAKYIQFLKKFVEKSKDKDFLMENRPY